MAESRVVRGQVGHSEIRVKRLEFSTGVLELPGEVSEKYEAKIMPLAVQ